MFPTIIRRAAQKGAEEIPLIYTNPYKAKRLWPPDFEKMSPKHQFRLERRFRRRSKLQWARPRWTKAVKMVQFGSIVFVAVYGVLFLDWDGMGNPEHPPFQTIRTWFFGLTGNIWGRDQVRRRDAPDEASPVSSSDS
ncbi:hypothetical protein LARI1_G008177 [Lachnellula arida]|uniref:Uncharacterized protein n=2 Tax=Lachnellula TaxID=47830 RepID=A0A8T9B396_9HELO|nr:hypothetical protein LARI1_G008177 [Lachnellula arida]TVY88257.1 hypothetical protein LAWI1_G006288 [Lachnellula willkommii]